MSKLSAALVTGLLALPWAPRSLAQEGPLVSDRPDFTESAATIAAGGAQLEFGITAERLDGETAWTLGEALLRLGLSEHWELRLTAPSYLSGAGPDGFADGGFGAKLLIVPESQGGRPAAALIVATSVPSGEGPLRSDAWQPEAKLCLAWDLAAGVSLSGNLNFARPVDAGERFDQRSASVSLGVELGSRLGGYLEWYGYSAETAGGPATNFLNGGVTFRVRDDFQLDARIGRGLGGDTADLFGGVGAALRF